MTPSASMSDDTRAIALLCGHFGTRRGEAKPLSPAEYHGFAGFLSSRELDPAALLTGAAGAALASNADDLPSTERIGALLSRERELATAMTRWHRAGIWVIGEGDRHYPAHLRNRLGSGGFPLLFGAGPIDRLDSGGVCIVGSRDSPQIGLAFARTLGSRCARESMTVISSDMRGVDREAISAALGSGGRVISVLSDSLEKATAAKRNRAALESGSMTLVTPFSPDTRFSVSNAMRANKYQYALSDVAVVVDTRRKGGVWSGADENRNEGWVPAFVRAGERMSPGNTALVHLGAQPITLEEVRDCERLDDLFLGRSRRADPDPAGAAESSPVPDLYGEFLRGLRTLQADGPVSEARVVGVFAIERSQARKWLARAVIEGHAEKHGRPARYHMLDAG